MAKNNIQIQAEYEPTYDGSLKGKMGLKIVGHVDFQPKRCMEYLDCRDCPLHSFLRCDNKIIDEKGNIIQT